jgi:hypothetical protein
MQVTTIGFESGVASEIFSFQILSKKIKCITNNCTENWEDEWS